MSAFYKKLLNEDEKRHSEAVKASEEVMQHGARNDQTAAVDAVPETSDADRARELNEQGASVAVNEDGQVVDKRQLLKGGLNVDGRKKAAVEHEAHRPAAAQRREINGAQVGRKQAMRERQSRMLAEQLEQAMKRSREDDDAQREELEKASKSRKTDGEISSAKERYLARKRAAEEEKKKGLVG